MCRNIYVANANIQLEKNINLFLCSSQFDSDGASNLTKKVTNNLSEDKRSNCGGLSSITWKMYNLGFDIVNHT